MARYPITSFLLAGTTALAGCGGTEPERVATTPAAERVSVQGSGIVVRGDYGPDDRGPFAFDGRYRVRFAQRGSGVDFQREVPFTAGLEQREAAGEGRRIALFERAERSGERTLRVHGRFHVVVEYGDSPYEIRFERVGA